MTSHELDSIIERAAAEFPIRLHELREHILEAASQALIEAQDQETAKPKVTVPSKLVIMLATSPPTIRTSASVSVSYKSEGEDIMLDKQPDLFSQPTQAE